MRQVVGALIMNGDSFLAGLRPPDKPNPLLWEFIGGKAEKGETLQEALKRECREEIDVEIEVGEIFAEADHEYPDGKIHLTIFYARIVSGEPRLTVHVKLKNIKADDIPKYNFCPADKGILNKIVAVYGKRK